MEYQYTMYSQNVLHVPSLNVAVVRSAQQKVFALVFHHHQTVDFLRVTFPNTRRGVIGQFAY